MKKSKSPLSNKSYELALEVVRIYKKLNTKDKEFVMSKQLLKAGTSVGANIREAQYAESKKDFVHKLGISQKECVESNYWLELLKESGYIDQVEYLKANDVCDQIYKMISSSIITARKSLN